MNEPCWFVFFDKASGAMSKPDSKPWSVAVVDNFAGGGQTANIFISGPINDGESYGTELAGAGDLVNQINNLESQVDDIDVTIQSPGGSISAGLAIYNSLVNHPARVTTRVAGMAASMGSVIVQAGDVREMPRNSFQMVHRAQGGAQGTADEVAATAKVIQQHEDELVDIYQRRTGKSQAEVREMISTDNYMNAASCLENGLCDKVIEPGEAEEAADKLSMDNLNFMAENRMAIPSYGLLPLNLADTPTVEDTATVEPETLEPAEPAVDPVIPEPAEAETEPVDPARAMEPVEEESESETPPAKSNLAARLFAFLAGKDEAEDPDSELKELVEVAGLQEADSIEIVGLRSEVGELKNQIADFLAETERLETENIDLKAERVSTEKMAATCIAKLGYVGAEAQELEAVPPVSNQEDSLDGDIEALRTQLATETDPCKKTEIARELKQLRNSN